ncbi:response regulator [Paraburkholderia sediminicola]|uniref:response regulator n=1 Tax=Paraburkholderia sediminicola TaxID=458836 RepID=UPI0038BB04D4
MVHRIYADSIDDFVMGHAVDARGPIDHPGVLVVDDYPAGTDAMQLLLEQDGFEARSMDDACAACEVAEQRQPFAVVVGLAMPGMTGFELARGLRAGALTREMLLVAFTARRSHEDMTRALEAGFDVYCVKPLTAGPVAHRARVRRRQVALQARRREFRQWRSSAADSVVIAHFLLRIFLTI